MDKILEIIDSCKTAEQLKTFWAHYIMKAANDQETILKLKGAYQLKVHQLNKYYQAQISNLKRERFPVDDEQPLPSITDDAAKPMSSDGPY
jgi:hypothetical protein